MRGDPRGGALRAALVRSGRGRLRGVWRLAHAALARVAFASVRPPRGSAFYARGSFGEGQPVLGLSDLDLVIVTPDAEGRHHARVRARWKRIVGRFPFIARHVDLRIAEEDELAAVFSSSPSIAPATDPPPLPLLASTRLDELSLLTRPGPYEPGSLWRLLRGPERRPPPRSDPPREAIAWMEIDHLWQYAFRLVRDPSGSYAPRLASKLVADAARAWLWLAHGERPDSRAGALRRALELAPVEEQALRIAIGMDARLGSREPADVTGALAGLARFSERVAALLAERAQGSLAVALVRAEEGPGLPLADWRGLAMPGSLGDRFSRAAGSPDEPAAVARALAEAGPWPALEDGGLVVLPSLEPPGSRVQFVRTRPVLRSAKCSAADPVPFALLAGESEARFSELRGFSAAEAARRAVAEHRAWLGGGGSGRDGLLSAARAGLFARSLADGQPELALDEPSVLERLGIARGDQAGLAAAAGGLVG